MNFNPTIKTDAYKITHWLQRPSNMTQFMNYGEPRSFGQHDKVLAFGMDYIIQKYFMTKVTEENILKGKKRSLNTFGTDKYFNEEAWRKVMKLGYYPLEIKAVKEGSLIPTSNVFFTCKATEDWFAPMVSHFEDWLMWYWYSSAVATRAFNIRKNLIPSFEASSDNPFYDFAVNDFGYRGGTFDEGATVGGMAFLTCFNGTDNLSACEAIEEYYSTENVGQSVWATEHSVATVWGPGNGEFDYIKAQLENAPDTAPVSIVIDSYDADNFIIKVVGSDEIKFKIMKKLGRVIFRPDSNDPLTNVCKYSELLANIFGYHINNKGYKILNHNVGLIQGDGMNEVSIPKLFNDYIKTGWSVDNICTGSGGGLLEDNLTRDTDRWAIKACYAEIDGKPINVSKSPKTDMTKASKSGLLKLHEVNGVYQTLQSSAYKDYMPQFNAYTDALEVVYRNGVIHRKQTFEDIRSIVNSHFNG